MAVGLEPWIYILRGCCALAVFVTILVAAPTLSFFGIGDAKSYKSPSGFRPILVSLFLLYLSDIVVLTVEAQSRGELPDATASISISIFALTSALQLEKLATLEKVGLSVSCIYLGCWALLSAVEFFTIIWLCLRPSSAPFPPQFGIGFTAIELLAYFALSFLFYQASWGRYERLTESDIENGDSDSLTESDIENGDAASESTRYDSDDESDSDSNGCKADPLGIRMEVRKEIDELGGWWRFIKKFRIFLKFMWPFDDALLQLRFILTVFIVIVGRIISVYKPLQTAILLDALASGADPWRPLVVVIAINVADTVSSYVVQLLWIDVSLQRASKLKVEVQSKIMSLDFSFHSQAQPTDVIKAVDNAGSVDTLLDSLIFQLGPNLVTFVVAIVQLFHRYGLYAILICTHTAAYYCIVEKRYVTVATREYDKCNTLRDEQERRRQDSVRGWSTVSNHNRVRYETDLFSSAVESWMSRWRRYRMSCYGFSATQSVILSLGFFTCYAFVVYKIDSGEGLVGDLVAFTGLWALLLDPIDYFTSIVSDTIQEFLDTARLRRILERELSIPNGDQNLEQKTGKIEFRDVSFSYPGSERPIIDHLSTVIEGGLTVAFVGQSGAGKSTICNLLMRNLVPTAGTILIDDQDITTLKKDSLHENIAMMPQNPYIFNRTVTYNVRYTNPDATDEEMYEACRKAGIHKTIMARKDGYETSMGDNGQNFSGGERQRILLSRLFLERAKIKLIDEGTSALDAETEAGIKQSIEEGLADETVILVAHRLSSIRRADRIFVLGTNGKIMEYGTHDELVAKNGEYTKLWKMHIGENIGVGDTDDLIDLSA
ncbi:mitochondrial ATP-binding cassette sub-family B member 6 [Lasiosphaeris hirsuta]|uniref:Mitochondrial ATP-binding cassette sub-family B member 6 n=1 Tax=Lasiosphaeris hirsuta TaxID=260670 RepID=A0AA39ZS79_9PEZI|nr:mitochondrial ATP-binding cassette sub-family B member 6 [Lasiosphaeris hirsuta]